MRSSKRNRLKFAITCQKSITNRFSTEREGAFEWESRTVAIRVALNGARCVRRSKISIWTPEFGLANLNEAVRVITIVK